VTVVQGDAAELPFPDHVFSSVIGRLVFASFESPEQPECGVQEFHRVLRLAGMFSRLNRDGWLQRAGHITAHCSGFARRRICTPNHCRLFRIAGILSAEDPVCALRATEA